MFILKLLLMLIVLGIIILVHEFGHFIWAKKFKVHIYEFSIGMGPLLFTHKGKDKIDYNIRAIPIGGFVAMAGEVYADDDDVDKKNLMCNKPWWQRLIILVAGVCNNFILAIVFLTIYAFVFGMGPIEAKIYSTQEDSAAEQAGIKAGDVLTSINGYKITSWDKAQIILYYKNDKEYTTFKVVHEDGTKETIKVTPTIIKDEETGEESKVYGISISPVKNTFVNKITYGFKKFGSLLDSMVFTIWGLISKKISLDALSGPVGIYEVVGEAYKLTFKEAVAYVMYLTALLSVNVGFINILPFPAFDGGHVLFILIEKIKGSPVNAKIENICHVIGFILIFLLMIFVTINDIIKLF